MATESTIEIPADPTFEQAIDLSQALLATMEQDTRSQTEIEQAIAALVASQNGARGFFVTYLSSDSPLADQPTPNVIQALRSAPRIVSALLAKNLVMSTAMILTHERQQHPELAAGSARVQRRTLNLIQQLQLPEIHAELHALHTSLTSGSGAYQVFLERWGYDAEQRRSMQQVVEQAIA